MAAALAGVVPVWASAACRSRPPPTREAVLSALAREVFVPRAREVVAASERLASVAAQLEQSPAALQRTRGLWTPALLSWKRVQSFRSGPFEESSALARSLYWPLKVEAVEAALAGSNALDERFVAELGADVKGLYALEYLLFPAGLDERAAGELFRGEHGARRAALSSAYARAIANHARAAANLLGDGAAYAERLARGAGESSSLVVGEIVRTIELLAVERLDRVIELDRKQKLVLGASEGGRSRTSHLGLQAQYLACEELYRGRGTGLADRVRGVSVERAARVEQRWEAARLAVRALDAPLESLVRSDRPRLVAAISALKLLEITLKLEVASMLGLTLDFRGMDGD
ncbi:MAG TPA: imelysin family protein [Polyangiaceae bacterium]